MNKPLLISTLVMALAACNQNTAPGNDREAQLDAPAKAAPIEDTATALANVEPGLMLPETMTAADIAALGGTKGKCLFRLTEVAFPSFLYEPDGNGAIKLNGRLIPVQASGPGRFASADLLVTTRMLDDTGDAGLQMQELIVAAPRAKDEFGFHGYQQCDER